MRRTGGDALSQQPQGAIRRRQRRASALAKMPAVFPIGGLIALHPTGHLSRKSFRPLLHAPHAFTAGNGTAITVISHLRYLVNAAVARQ
jgi:hypothetical protein